jgi:hypothetical protein
METIQQLCVITKFILDDSAFVHVKNPSKSEHSLWTVT